VSLQDTLAAIDAATGCQWCQGSLGKSPSRDFCSQDCQEAWHASRTERLTGYREPWDRPWDFPGVGTDTASTRAAAASVSAAWMDEAFVRQFAGALEGVCSVMQRLADSLAQGLRATRRDAAGARARATDHGWVRAEGGEWQNVGHSEAIEETPQQRALRLRQERNTGPQRDPHARHGRGQ
jgi:hypothetical protein